MDNATRAPRRKAVSHPLPAPRAGRSQTPPGEIDLGGLTRHLGYALKRSQLRVFENFIAAVAPLKLTPAQYSVLLLLDNNPGRNQTEIAAALGILRPNFVTLLNALEKRGLCSRTRSSDDRRSHVLALTPKGLATLAGAKQLVAKHEKKLMTVLTETERSDLIEMLQRLTHLL